MNGSKKIKGQGVLSLIKEKFMLLLSILYCMSQTAVCIKTIVSVLSTLPIIFYRFLKPKRILSVDVCGFWNHGPLKL